MTNQKQPFGSPDFLPIAILELLENTIDIGYWCINLNTRLVQWSDVAYRLHDIPLSTEAFSIAKMLAAYHPEDRQRLESILENAVRFENEFQAELRLPPGENPPHLIRIKGACRLDETGRAVALMGVFLKKQTEQAQAFSRSTDVQAYVDSSNDGFWDWYIQDDYEYMSPRFWDILGYQPHEKPHKPSAWQELIFEDDLTIALNNFNRHIATKGKHPFYQEVRYHHKNGSTVTVICKGKVVEWDEQGQPLRMVGTHTDVTLLKQKQKELEEALSFQKLLLSVNKELIFVKDKDFKIVLANPAFMAIYPDSMQDKIIGYTTFEAFPAEQFEGFLEKDRLAFEQGYSEAIEQANDKVFLSRKTRFETPGGEKYILGVSSDITEFKKNENELKKANQELEEFAYRTSHDLRSPLVSSIKLIDITQKTLQKGDTEKAQKYLGLIQDSLVKLESLVTDILQLTRQRHSDEKRVEIDLRALVKDTLSKLAHLENYNKIKFTNNIDVQGALLLNRENLVLIIENLLSNAIKYCDADEAQPFVRIDACINGSALSVAITDNGIGFPEAAREQVFGMFKRFHPQTSFGSGLGLYMVKRSVEKLNGSIALNESEGNTRFDILIPVK